MQSRCTIKFWTSEPAEYSNLFFDLDLLDLILQKTTLNGNKNKTKNMPPSKRARITDLLPGAMINIGLIICLILLTTSLKHG
jgi:hypothetical protein